MKRIMLVAATVLLAGCYRYVPIDTQAAPTGEEVRVSVTRSGASELQQVMTPDASVARITGRVFGQDGGDLLLRVRVGSRQEGFHAFALEQTIRVPGAEILAMERKEINALGTSAFVAGSVALAGAIVLTIMDSFGGDASDDGDDPVLLELLRVPIG